MSCNKPYKTAEANAKSYLRTHGVIDKYLNILDYAKFVKFNRKLTESGIKNYGVDAQWFFAEQNGTKAVPNTHKFKQVDLSNSYPDPNIFEDTREDKRVDYTLTAVHRLSSPKAEAIFQKGEKNNWSLEKILTELQIPKEQKAIILDKNLTNREDIITSLLADNSFVVEINTATSNLRKEGKVGSYDNFRYNDNTYYFNPILDSYKENGKEITKKEYEDAWEEFDNIDFNTNTQYYSNLTVPGGTNYTENEISTPSIEPSIKGHAQFSTDNGIGWFRSDEKLDNAKTAYDLGADDYIEEDGKRIDPKNYTVVETGTPTKIRRILEVQSDLFQKGRDRKDLVTQFYIPSEITINGNVYKNTHNEYLEIWTDQDGKQYIEEDSNFIKEYYKEQFFKKHSKENTFLQLLNKKNNWVTFFVKTIIQDSAKKGYEKVLFPKGDTAAMIEGHQTLDTYRRHTLERIKVLEELGPRVDLREHEEDGQDEGISKTVSLEEAQNRLAEIYDKIRKNEEELEQIGIPSDENAEQYKDLVDEDIVYLSNKALFIEKAIKNSSKDNEIDYLKEELRRVEDGETQLSSISNFYEQTITNILNKNGYNPVEITDEYGNKWNQVKINEERDLQDILLDKGNSVKGNIITEKLAKKHLNHLSKKYGIESSLADMGMFAEYGKFDRLINAIYINRETTLDRNGNLTAAYNPTGFISQRTIYHEYLHPFVEVLEDVNPDLYNEIYEKAIKENESNPFTEVSHYTQNKQKEELVVRYLDRLSDNETVPSLLQQFLNWLSSFFFKKRKNNKETLKKLSKDTTVEELYEIFKGYGNIKEEVQQVIDKDNLRSKVNFINSILENDEIPQYVKDNYKKELDLLTSREDKPFEENMNKSQEDKNNDAEDNVEVPHTESLPKKEIEESKKNKSKNNRLEKKVKDSKTIMKEILSKLESVKSRTRSKKGYKTQSYKKFEKLEKHLEEVYEKSANEALFEFTTFANKEIAGALDNLRMRYGKDTITISYLSRAKDYISIYNSLDDISALANRQFRKKEITKEDYDNIEDILVSARKNFKNFTNEYIDIARDLMAEKLVKYYNRPKAARMMELRKVYNKIKPKGISKEDWVNERIKEEIDDLRQEALDQLRQQLEFVPMDIGAVTLQTVSEKNINNDIVKLFSTLLDEADKAVREFSIAQRNQYKQEIDKYKPTGSSNVSKYGRLVQKDTEGNHYLMSEYKAEFIEEIKKRKAKVSEVKNEYGYKSPEHKEAVEEFNIWKKENLQVIVDDKAYVVKNIPIDKWKNPDYAKLTDREKTLLNFLVGKAKEADELTLGYKALVTNFMGSTFVKLPSVRKSDLERVLQGQIKGLIKDKVGDTHKVREDATNLGELSDDEFTKRLVTVNNEERHLVPIHFRNKIESKDQSLDLPTIFLLNSSMSKEFNVKQELEADSKLLIDVVGEANVNKTETITNRKIISAIINKGANKEDVQEVYEKGLSSNLYTKIKSMTENRIYKITELSSGKIGQTDIAVIANTVGAYAGHLALAVNYLSAIPNLMQGKIQNFIESVGGTTFSRSDLRWAEKTYWEQIKNGGLSDIGSQVNQSKLFMLIEKFDLMGDFNAIKNKFEDSTRFRALFKSSTLHGMNQVAEHYIQSTLMLAILRSVRIKNKDGKYIDINGKVVSDKSKAMSLYDAYDVENNMLKLKENAHHTSFTLNDLRETGELEHQELIKRKIIDLQGQYDSKLQSHIQRYWFGKLIFMFRKWLVPAYFKRWRGALYALTQDKEYEDLGYNQKFYDDMAQEFTEGMYASFIRFIKRGVIPAIKELKIELATTNWNNLTDMEKANIHRTIRELVIMSLMVAGAKISLAAAKSAPDEDKDELYLLAYLFKRQETELMQYYSPSDQMRIFRTPFAAMTTLEKTVGLLNQLLPWNIGEEYEQGKNKGEYKAWIKAKKMVPALSQTERTAKESLSFLTSISD